MGGENYELSFFKLTFKVLEGLNSFDWRLQRVHLFDVIVATFSFISVFSARKAYALARNRAYLKWIVMQENFLSEELQKINLHPLHIDYKKISFVLYFRRPFEEKASLKHRDLHVKLYFLETTATLSFNIVGEVFENYSDPLLNFHEGDVRIDGTFQLELIALEGLIYLKMKLLSLTFVFLIEFGG